MQLMLISMKISTKWAIARASTMKLIFFHISILRKNRLEAKVDFFGQSSGTLENTLFLLILSPGIHWCHPFSWTANIFQEKSKMAAKMVVFLIRNGFVLFWELSEWEMVIIIVRPRKWVCHTFSFLEKIQVRFFFHIQKGYISTCQSYSSQMLIIMAKPTKGTWPMCYFWEKFKMAAKKADFVGIPFEKCFTRIWEPIFATDVHQYGDLFIKYFYFSEKFKMAAKFAWFLFLSSFFFFCSFTYF